MAIKRGMELPFDPISYQVSSVICCKCEIWNNKFSKNYLLAPTWTGDTSGLFWIS